MTGADTLTASPRTLRAIAGDQASVSVAVGGSGSFTSLVSLTVSGAPAGVTPTISSSLVAPGASAFVTLAVAGTVVPGTYPITVSGESEVDGRPLARTATFTIEILAADTAAVTGRVLTAEAVPQPIPGVTVTLGSAFALTDAAGNSVLLAPPAGANMLLVDGRTASTATAQYPPVELSLTIAPTGPTRVPFIVYLPKLDTAHPITLPLDAGGFTTATVQATTPLVPGLVVTIPVGTKITGPDGNPVRQLTITPVPVDRSPMPFPAGVTAPLLFTIQPGGAVPSQPLPITFPNPRQAAAGGRAQLYFFDLPAGGWAIWGTGTVNADGTAIVSDAGFGLPRFAWHFPFCSQSCPVPAQTPRKPGAEPVDLPTGRFLVTKTDLVLPGRLPITIERTYQSGSAPAGSLGLGWQLGLYDHVLTPAGPGFSLMLADRSAYLFTETAPGQWTNGSEPALRGAVLTRLPGEFSFALRFKDGTVHRYERIPGVANAAAPAAVVDRHGNTVTITRQMFGLAFTRVVQIADPAGRSLFLAYDEAGRLLTVTDPLGRAVRYTYDAQGRLEAVTDPAGGVTRYTYDTSHRILSITDPRGITFLTNEYDAQGRVSRQTQADGSVWTLAYTVTAGLVTETTVTDPRGHVATSRFDSQGFTLSETDALGQTTVFEYAPGSNLLTAVTDPLGRVTRFEYDAQGNVTARIDAAGQRWSLTYEPTFSQVTSRTDPLGQVTGFEYDAAGNLTAVVDPTGSRTTLSYNAVGQPVSTTDPLGNATAFEYDEVGNLIGATDPLGHRVSRDYDPVSRLTRQTDPLGRATSYGYDAVNRLTQVTDPLSGLTRFSYDGNGNLLSATDARGSVTQYTYDSMDRLATRTDPLLRSESYAYDASGNLTQFADRKGQLTTFSYDALNRRTQATYADSMTRFSYDAVGRLLQATDSVGGSLGRQYDALDRLLGETTGLGTVAYTYDPLGRRTRMDVPGQASVLYGYDAASRLTQVIQGSQAVALEYDPAARRTRLTLPSQVSTEYQYDVASRLTALVYRNALGPLGDLTYEYDAAGNRITVGGSLARTLVPAAVATATYDAANQQLAFGDKTLAYDPNGNLTSLTDSSGTTTYAWDARNRLTTLAGITTGAFVYDALGRRVAKTVDGATTQHLHDGADIVQQFQDGSPVGYLRGLRLDEPFVRNGSEFYLADALGSVIGLTDPSGALVTRYAYEPFGATVVEGAASPNPFQFTGRENDATNLYYYRARYYSPGLQRFVSEDPIRFPMPPFPTELKNVLACNTNLEAVGFSLLSAFHRDPRRAHPYTYVFDNPVSATDPLGFGPPSECIVYDEGCVGGASSDYPCAARVVCRNTLDTKPTNCYRNCLITKYRKGCTTWRCQFTGGDTGLGPHGDCLKCCLTAGGRKECG